MQCIRRAGREESLQPVLEGVPVDGIKGVLDQETQVGVAFHAQAAAEEEGIGVLLAQGQGQVVAGPGGEGEVWLAAKDLAGGGAGAKALGAQVEVEGQAGIGDDQAQPAPGEGFEGVARQDAVKRQVQGQGQRQGGRLRGQQGQDPGQGRGQSEIGDMLLLILGPLLIFTPLLARTRRQGLREYGIFANTYNRAFHQRWVAGEPPADEPLLGSADIQSLADLGNSFGLIREMKIFPFSQQQILQIAIISSLPGLPLIFLVMPVGEILQLLAGALL